MDTYLHKIYLCEINDSNVVQQYDDCFESFTDIILSYFLQK